MSDTVADYILKERDLSQKEIIVEKLAKRTGIFFDKTVLYKTEILKMIMEEYYPNLDENKLLTAMLLCNCKKKHTFSTREQIEIFAKDGAEYLSMLGFDDEFCELCEGLNRYSGIERTLEMDLIEAVDNLGGLLLDRSDRAGYSPKEALIILEERNFKGNK